jgi:ABC-type sugar transport system ATPase subunit
VLQEGAPEEVYRRPASPAVARQLGQPAINLFAARRDGASWAAAGVNLLPAAGTAASATIGVRPEDLSLTGGTVAGTVRVVEDLGPARLAVVDWAGLRCHALVDKRSPIAAGDRVAPSFRAERAVVWADAGAEQPTPG